MCESDQETISVQGKDKAVQAHHPGSPARARRLAPGTVHKAAAGEVLLTGAERGRADHFTVTARWSRDRFLRHGGADGTCDPLLLVETLRQAAIHLSHRWYGVPRDRRFVLLSLDFDTGVGELRHRGRMPLPVVLDVACAPRTISPRRFAMTARADLWIDGERCGSVGMSWEAVHPRTYELLRGRTPVTAVANAPASIPLPAPAVGYWDERDVLLGAGPTGTAGPTAAGQTWWLCLNRDHPVLFDHDTDHIPGIVLLEAFRQAARAAGPCIGPTPGPSLWTATSASAAFESFGELDAPVAITARPAEDGGGGTRDVGVWLAARQDGRTLATAVFRGACRVPSGLGESGPRC
jgi:2-oxo-3-(phosphooxy)propyl 3-oxoalkanoate synthase